MAKWKNVKQAINIHVTFIWKIKRQKYNFSKNAMISSATDSSCLNPCYDGNLETYAKT